MELRRLARFLPESERTESLLVQRFEEGLAPKIRMIMGTFKVGELRALITAVMNAECLAIEQGMIKS